MLYSSWSILVLYEMSYNHFNWILYLVKHYTGLEMSQLGVFWPSFDQKLVFLAKLWTKKAFDVYLSAIDQFLV